MVERQSNSRLRLDGSVFGRSSEVVTSSGVNGLRVDRPIRGSLLKSLVFRTILVQIVEVTRQRARPTGPPEEVSSG